jgi:hypothetical protein
MSSDQMRHQEPHAKTRFPAIASRNGRQNGREESADAAVRVLGLADRCSPRRLEAAGARALRFDDVSHPTLKRILQRGLEVRPLSASPAPVQATMFVRSAAELLGSLVGGELWNRATRSPPT